MGDKRGDEEKIRRMQQQAEREHQAAMKAQKDFQARRAAQLKAEQRAKQDKAMLDKAAKELQAKNKKAQQQKGGKHAKQTTGGLCGLMVLAGAGGLAALIVALTHGVRALS